MAYRTLGTDRILEVSSIPPATSLVSLGGALAGFRPFNSVLANNDTCAYFIEAVNAAGALTGAWERGFGSLQPGPGLARNVVVDSSNGGALVNFATNVRVGSAPMSDTTMAYPDPGGRLTMSATSPLVDATGSMIYYLPYVSDRVPLWNGAGIQVVSVPAAGYTLNIGGLNAAQPFDIFGYISGGTMAMQAVGWATLTTRIASGLALLNGFLCKGDDATRRYLGSACTSAAGTVSDVANIGGGTGQPGRRLLWNMYNRMLKPINMIDNTGSWTYATSTWRIIRGLAATQGCVEIFRGLDEDVVTLTSTLTAQVPQGSGAHSAIGIDGANMPYPLGYGTYYNGNTGVVQATMTVPYSGLPGLGYHYLALLEIVGGGVTSTFGQNLSGQTGMWGTVRS